jgi:ribonuclease HI
VSEYSLFFDGAFKGKVASFGFVLYLDNKQIDRGYGILGTGGKLNATIGEYYGLSYGLDSFVRHVDRAAEVLNIYGDSAFVISQIKKDIHDYEELQIIKFKLKQVSLLVSEINIKWIPRAKNQIANALAKTLRIAISKPIADPLPALK